METGSQRIPTASSFKTIKVLNEIYDRILIATNQRGRTVFDTIDEILERNLPEYEDGKRSKATAPTSNGVPHLIVRNNDTISSAMIRKSMHRRLSKIAKESRRKLYRVTEEILERGLPAYEGKPNGNGKAHGTSNHSAVK